MTDSAVRKDRRDSAGIIEGCLLLIAGLVGLADGVRLVVYQDPNSVEDFTGPGRYLVAISFFMAIAGAVHLMASARLRSSVAGETQPAVEGVAWRRIASTIAALIAYILLLDTAGYFLATFVFFALILMVMGHAFGLRLALLSLAFSAGLYLIFVKALGMTFPHGMLFT